MKAHDPDPRKEGNNGTPYLLMSCIDPVWKDDLDEVVVERRPRCVAEQRSHSGVESLELQRPVALLLGTLDRLSGEETRVEIWGAVLLIQQAGQR